MSKGPDIGWWLLWILVMLTMFVNYTQANNIHDLQRRVGTLEQQRR